MHRDQNFDVRLRSVHVGGWSSAGWEFLRRRSPIFCEGNEQFCDSYQKSEHSNSGIGIVWELIEMVKRKVRF
jgi:hypothetical protein